MRVQVKKLNSGAKLPTRGSEHAAGYDLYACLNGEVRILPGQTERIPTGLALALPEGTFGAVFARSGLAVKEGLRPANCVGVIDSDYRGELMVALRNDSAGERDARVITPGERIAQLVLLPYLPMEFEESGELPDTHRGAGGFGSTGA